MAVPMPEGRVCFVVSELLGVVRNGGIATATTHAALVLSGQGYGVDLLYCGHVAEMEEQWAMRYADAGVTVEWIDRSSFVHPWWMADSYRVYHQLKDRAYAAIVLQDWKGLGFCSMVAKRAGLAFDRTRLVHIVHGPDEWLREANRQLEVDVHQLGSAHMERRSAELADAIVGPSRHLIEWMSAKGWDLPTDRHVIPYFTEGHTFDVRRKVDDVRGDSEPLTELVFFGRLEERKGVRVLIGALNLLGPEDLHGLRLTFLGRPATITSEDVLREIDPTVRRALGGMEFIGHLDQSQARAYLQAPGRLALIPSYLDNSPNVVYECLEDRISFLASRAGGTGELVHEEDREAVLFDPAPASLAEILAPLVSSRRKPPPARPSFDGEASLAAWRRLLEPPPPPEVTGEHDVLPPVTVVIAHHNQPRLIWDTVRSIDDQDYPADVEIVIVDDGSNEEAVANLTQLTAQKWKRTVRVHHQENRYLGAARNAGLRLASYDHIAFVDDDDTVDPQYLRCMSTALVRFGADAVTVAIHSVKAAEDGSIETDAEEAVWAFLGGAVDLATSINTLGGAAALFRRPALEAVGGFHELRGVGHEDWDVLVRIALGGGTIVWIPEAPYHYLVRPGSMLRSTTTWQNMQPLFESYRRHLPGSVASWPELTRGQQDLIDRLRRELWETHDRVAVLQRELDDLERYLAVVREPFRSLRAQPDPAEAETS